MSGKDLGTEVVTGVAVLMGARVGRGENKGKNVGVEEMKDGHLIVVEGMANLSILTIATSLMTFMTNSTGNRLGLGPLVKGSHEKLYSNLQISLTDEASYTPAEENYHAFCCLLMLLPPAAKTSCFHNGRQLALAVGTLQCHTGA